MSHTAVEFGVTELTPEVAATNALTAADELPGSDVNLVDGTIVSYKRQPTLDELQHVAKQLLPKPTSPEFAATTTALVGTSLKPTMKKGKRSQSTQAALWAGNLRRLAREIAASGKATGRAAGKRSVRTGAKAATRTRGTKGPGLNDPVTDLVGAHCNQQAPTIGVEIKPEQSTDADAYYVPAHCAVFRKQGYVFANVRGGSVTTDHTLLGFSTADGVESTQTKIFKELQHVSIVATGLVSLLCSPSRADSFEPGDTVYLDEHTVSLARKPAVKVATYTLNNEGTPIGTFIEKCSPKGGIRVQLKL